MLAIAVGIAVALGAPNSTAAAAGFRLADGSGGCAYLAKRLVVACRSVRAGPGFALAATGEPLPLTPGSTRWPLPRRVLRARTVWRRGGVTCLGSARSAMCTNRSGATITVSREAVAALATPAVGSR